MRTGQTHLFNPGPTNVPDAVRQAMTLSPQAPRPGDLGQLALGLCADLKRVFKAGAGQVMVFPGSGTSAWEAAITNTLNPGDKVLMARHGQFSTLWVRMAEMLGLVPIVVDLPWGASTPVDAFERILGRDVHDEIKAVFVTHTETTTGVVSDVAAVRRALDSTFHDALLCVDGVSSIGSMDFRMDDWGVDLAVTGSQKGLMMPAGLGVLCISPKALEASRAATLPRAYFDFADTHAMAADGGFPGAPPPSLLHGLRAALDRILAEGLEAVFARHARLAEGIRRGVQAWGLDLVAEHHSYCSDTVSAIRVPDGVDAREVLRIAYEEFNASFGAGLGPLNGKVFRIGHLGDFNEGMALNALSLAELALMRAGAGVVPGSGTGAAQAWFAKGAPQTFAVAAE